MARTMRWSDLSWTVLTPGDVECSCEITLSTSLKIIPERHESRRVPFLNFLTKLLLEQREGEAIGSAQSCVETLVGLNFRRESTRVVRTRRPHSNGTLPYRAPNS